MKKATVEKNRGSEWRKWDLHLHSFYTSLANSFSSSNKNAYIKKIVDEKIEVVGLTNYFNFSDDDWALKAELEAKKIKVFLNIELRLTYTNKEDSCCDLHLIFSDALTRSDIDTFLTKLNCSVSGSSKTLAALTNPVEKGIAVVDFREVVDALKDPAVARLRGKVLIGMLSRGKGNSRSSRMYESLTQDSNFIVHSSDKVQNVEDDIKYWSGNEQEKPLKCKALFQSSDAHSVEKIGQKYSWVKGAPTFETLRQAVVDYGNRVLIQERNPIEHKNASSERFIDRIEYTRNEETIVLRFNKDINAIIGKRGGGKSVLLKHIAFDVLGEQENPGIKQILRLQDFKIYWCDGSLENKFVEYIPQNYLSTITYEDGEKYGERDEMLKERLFNNELFKNADTNKSEIIDAIELQINTCIKQVLGLRQQVINTRTQLKSLGDVASKDTAIATKQKEIGKFGKVDITEDDIGKQTLYSVEIDSLDRGLKLLEQDVSIIENANKDAEVSFVTVDDAAFLGLSPTTFELIRKHVQEASNQDIKAYLDNLLDNLRKDIKKKKLRKTTVEKQLTPINKKLQKNKAVEAILKEINSLDKEKKEIESLDKFILETSKEIEALIRDLVDTYSSFKERIEGVVQTLKNAFRDLSFITFDFTVGYQADVYKRMFFDVYVDGRSGEPFRIFYEEHRDFDKDELLKMVSDIVTDDVKLKVTGGDKESALVALLGCRYDIDFTKSVKYKDGEKLVDFENMTGGQKAMALLDLIFHLSRGGYPIIIDQPENDIDVSGISSDLKKLILDQKQIRQVIMATHSPNLLLLADSENVVVAENKNNLITYHNGGVEDRLIQDNIVNILEGGKDALEKRMCKLGLFS